MATWVPSFDDSFDPINDLPAAYAAGYRVWARYVPGIGSSGKQWTRSEIAAWFAQGDDTGVAMLAEGVGDEPIVNPGVGEYHGRTARLGVVRIGVDPDQVLCSPAVDRNVNQSQTMGPVQDYMIAWSKGYQGLPVPYMEVENGGRLVHAGDAAAVFTPAAYSWNESGHLVTPDNAPDYVCQTQEHNGVKRFGGTIDIGHTRTDAPHVYWNPKGQDMTTVDLTPAAIQAIWKALTVIRPDNYTKPGDLISAADMLTSIAKYNYEDTQNGRTTNTDLDALKAELDAQGAKLDAILLAIHAGGGAGSVSGDLEVTGTLHVASPPSS